MRWIDEPPCTSLDVVSVSPTRLELKGPGTGPRLQGGLVAAVGATFGAFAVPFLRLPIPAPFKVVPAAFVAIGSGLGAAGLSAATARVSAVFDRRQGVTITWRAGVLPERKLTLAIDELEAAELSAHEQTFSSDSMHSSRTVTTWRLNLVTRKGKAYALELFGLKTQAALRLRQVEEALFAVRAPPPRRKGS